jgi:hypothetical protein
MGAVSATDVDGIALREFAEGKVRVERESFAVGGPAWMRTAET